MRRVFGILTACLLSLFGMASAQAAMSVRVDIAAQRMQVTTTDGEAYNWTISSGRKGFRSPNGVFRPTRLEKNWYSRKYGGAMPYAVFFRGGYAIHGTNAVGALGRPASHGCIRLHTANAAKFFALVKKHGAGGTRIALHGSANDGLSQFAMASGSAKTRLAAAKSVKSSLAKVAPAKGKAVAQNRKAPNWSTARDQILLRPSLPDNALGFQPYDLQRYHQTGPRWP
jgi:hypothetical protein